MAGEIRTDAKPHGRQSMAAAGGKRQNLAVAPLDYIRNQRRNALTQGNFLCPQSPI
jgi:hypothetical protein